MKKGDIELYNGNPSINVKVQTFGRGRGLTAEKLGCSEETFDKALEYAWEMAQEQFWEDAQEQADYHLREHGPFDAPKVYQEGRSGGHLIVTGLPDVETWNALQVSAWGRFVKAIEEDIAYRCSDEVIEEDIRANHWNEDGAEKYNFIDRKDGSTVCIAEEKKRVGLLHGAAQDLLDAFKTVIAYHREHDSGEGELFGMDYVTTCISAVHKAEGR